jgi:YHS domain-containing protein
MKTYSNACPWPHLGLSTLMVTMWTLPAAAHVPQQAPVDPGIEATSNLVITAIAMGLIGLGIYHFIAFAASRVSARGQQAHHEGRIRLGAALGAIGATLLFWWLSTPTAHSNSRVRQSGHRDAPQHGGQIEGVGNNHVEAVVGPDGAVAVYLMGISETLPYAISQSDLWATVQAGAGGSAQLLLHASPQTGDPKGQASAFVGMLDPVYRDKPVTLSLTAPLDGGPQVVTFELGPGNNVVMPTHDTAPTVVTASNVTNEERRLFLTPGGNYTQADIAANGGTTPDNKYAGMMANHHLNPKKGTYTCPITKTQANTKFAWIVGGRKYLFCCPPCISEFVKEAKNSRHPMPSPAEYIQR